MLSTATMALPFTARREEGTTTNMSTNITKPAAKPRRISVKELARTNRKLKKKLQKENKRLEDIARLNRENDELSFRLLEIRSPRNNDSYGREST